MITFPTTTVPGIPTDLVVTTDLIVYKCIAVKEIPSLFPDGIVHCQSTGPEQWEIALCENPADAVERTTKISDPVSKASHVTLEITFTPLGFAHYRKVCQGPDYHWQATMHIGRSGTCETQRDDMKVMETQKYADWKTGLTYHGDTDWKGWHFHGDIPLQASDEQGNVLITTRIIEIP